MQKIYALVFGLATITFLNFCNAQSVLNPNDSVITYNSANPPTQPAYGQIGKWVRTKRLSWNTDSYKAYIYKGCAFRLKFPKTYNASANDGKKYPMLVFFHGLGETGSIYDNEYQLYHGGQQFSDNVDNGNFDGYVLCMQSQGFWGGGQYQFIAEIIDYMVANNKLDAFRVSDNGLSAGGQGTWEMFLNFPTYIASALPMSNVSIGYTDTSVVNKCKFTPFWNFQGGLDGAPAPPTAQQVRDAMLNAGGNYKYTEYPDLGHGTWDRAWSEPDFYPFISRCYSSNPWALYGRTEFCSLDSVNVTLGLVKGFDEYQWRKDNNVITGASSNTLQVTTIGTYDARVRRGSVWSDWSRIPVVVKIKAPTVTPAIQVSGLASKVLPALDGSTTVKLEVPDGYATYLWKDASDNTISNTRYATVAPGAYKVKVTELYGCSSSFSNPFTVVNANGINKPDAATNLRASTLSKTSVQLNWSNNPAPVYNETNFEVYQSLQSGSNYKLVGITAADIVTYTITGLNSNTKYFYKIRAVNNTAAAAASNESFAVTQADNTPPTAPSNLAITSTTRSSVTLSWTASTDDVGVSKYEVYVNGVKSYITTATQFTVANLMYGQTYTFYIKARDLSNNLSASSNQITGQPLLNGLNYKYYTFVGTWNALPDFNTLTPVKTGTVANVTLDPKTQSDNFSFLWEGFIKIPVTGSYTFRTNSDDGSKLYLGALNQTTSAYSYNATALVNNDGLHAPQDKTSSTVTLTAGTYPIAISFYEQGGGESITVSWNTPQTNGAFVAIPNSAFADAQAPQPTSGNINYKYYTFTGTWNAMPDFNTLTPAATGSVSNIILDPKTQSDNFAFLWEGYISVPVAGTYYFRTNSDDGSKLYLGALNQTTSAYSYSATALVNNDGLHSAQDKTSSAVTLAAGVYPIAVTFYEQAGSESINVSWNTPQTSGAFVAIPNSAFVKAPVGSLKYKYYTYTGSWSSLPNFSTLTPAATGSLFNVSLANATQTTNYSFLYEGYINIPVTGTYYFRTNSDDGSKLYLGSLNQLGSAYNYSATALVNNDGIHAAQDKTSSAVSLTAGIYPIAISYYQQTGGSSLNVSWNTPQTSGAYIAIPNSAFVDSTGIIVIPNKPTNLTATAAAYNKINLSWTDNSTNEFGFEISRSTDASNFTVIATVATNVKSYTDSALTANTTYYYRVRATGNGGGTSDYDKEGLGVNYAYYEQTGLTTLPDFNTLTPKKTGRIANFVLGQQAVADNFQFKYYGTINIPTTGTYTFYTNSDDGSKLYLDGFSETYKVVDNNGAHAAQEKSGTKYLTAGAHAIYVTYMEITGGESLTVSYAGPNIAKQVIPSSVLGVINSSATTQAAPTPPTAPTTLDASGASTSVVKVVWADKSSNETKFEIYRSDNTNANYFLLNTLPANTVSYNDSNLYSNSVYYYKVRAINDAGVSAYTNEDSAKTKNILPVISKLSNVYMRYDATMQLNVQATDSDGSQFTFALKNQPAFASIVNNGNGSATVSLNPAGTQGVFNNIKVVVTDANGGSDSTSFNLTVGTNYTPVITASIPDYTINEGDTVNIPLVANDSDNDALTWTVSNVPGVYNVSTISNTASSLYIKPNYAAAGVYMVQATVSDGKGATATTQFKLTVVDKNPNKYVYVRFADQDPAPAPWNSITGVSTYNLKDANGANSNINLLMQTDWFRTYHEGPNTGNNSGVYPDAILQDYYYFGTFGGPETVDSKLTGLDTSSKYNLTFFAASNYSGAADNGVTTYTINGQTVEVAVQNNTQNTATISNVKPNADGSVTFTMAKKDANTPVGYINSLVISSLYDDMTAPAAPKALNANAVAGTGVQLAWTDVAYNETGDEIYRSATANGTFIKIAQTGADAVNYLDTSAAGNTQYFYKIRAINTYGASAYTDAVSVTTLNKVPQINPIANVILKNNQTATVSIVAKDDATDNIRLSVNNLPSFATFTDNGNGTGSINITPSSGSTGIYPGVVVTAKDNSDSSRSTSFDISVIDKDVSSVYCNFSDGSLAPKPWNNLTGWPFAGTTFSNLTDDSNVPTGISVTLVDGFEGVVAAGMRPGNGKVVYPEVVMRTAEYESSTATRTIKVSGLSSSKKYNFVFFNSHDDGLKGITNFTINGQTVTLNATYNINKTVQINGITADANGNVTISVAKASGSDYAFISSLVIQSYDAAVSTLSPTDLRVIDTKRSSVTLQWADRGYNETGVEVWRATSANGSYTLLKTLAANTTSYTDAGLTQNTTYYYTVRAVKSSVYSTYSNAVAATTYGYAVQINFTDVNNAPAPWNNLNSVPQLGYTWSNFNDELSQPTSMGMQVTNTWAGLYSDGLNPLNNSGVYPDSVMIDSYGLFPGQTGTLKVTGLNLSMKYDFTFFASSKAYGDVNVAYTINGKTVLLNTSLNTNGTVTLYGVTPDDNGEVNISVAPGTTTSQYGLIGAMVVQGYNASSTTVIPNAPSSFTQQTIASTKTESVKKAEPIKNNDTRINAYPNPFVSYFNLSVNVSKKENVLVEVFNISGKLVYQYRFENLNEGVNNLKIQPNSSMLASGIYVVRVSSQNQNSTQVLKLVKE